MKGIIITAITIGIVAFLAGWFLKQPEIIVPECFPSSTGISCPSGYNINSPDKSFEFTDNFDCSVNTGGTLKSLFYQCGEKAGNNYQCWMGQVDIEKPTLGSSTATCQAIVKCFCWSK